MRCRRNQRTRVRRLEPRGLRQTSSSGKFDQSPGGFRRVNLHIRLLDREVGLSWAMWPFRVHKNCTVLRARRQATVARVRASPGIRCALGESDSPLQGWRFPPAAFPSPGGPAESLTFARYAPWPRDFVLGAVVFSNRAQNLLVALSIRAIN